MCNHVMQNKIKSTIINLSTTENIFNASIQKDWKKACSQYYAILIHGTHTNMLRRPFKELNNLIALNIYNLEKKGRNEVKKYLYKQKIKNVFKNLKSRIITSTENKSIT